MKDFLIVNPGSGTDSPTAAELRDAAAARGVEVRLLEDGDDLQELARSAGADVLGMAGGDGSLAAVATVAIEQDVPFVCIPFGTRNHFARDLGLDRDDPIGALGRLRRRRRAEGRRGARRRPPLPQQRLARDLRPPRAPARAPSPAPRRPGASARPGADLQDRRRRQRFTIDGRTVRARLVLVSNNDYTLDLLSLGERERLDEGKLHLYVPHGFRRITWEEHACTELEIGAPQPRLRTAIDGEPVELDAPVRFRIEPLGLRVLVPRAPEPE